MNLRRTLPALMLAGAVLTGTGSLGTSATSAGPRPTTPASVTSAHLISGELEENGTVGQVITSTLQAPFALLRGLGGTVPRWNPCQTVQWRFNPAGAPAGGFKVVVSALNRIGHVSGLRFQYMGGTNAVPTSAYLNQAYGAYKPLLIGWTNAAHSDLLRNVSARTVGVTRVKWVGWTGLPGGLTTSQLATGAVAFNVTTKAPNYGANSRYTYALHELGHAVGLNHVVSGSNLMNAIIPPRMTDLGSGDWAGLQRVGASGGCLTNLR